MAFVEIGGGVTYIKWSETKKGKTFTGYLGKTVKSKEYDSYSVYLETDEGMLGLPLTGHLKYCLSMATEGDYVRITYKGTSDKVFRGRNPHEFACAKDPSRRRGANGSIETVSQDEIDFDFDNDSTPF